MAQKPKPDEESGLLVAAAKTIGKAAGKIAAASGVQPAPATPPKPHKRAGQLAAKNKSRLPRRQKKQLKKQHAANQTRSAGS